jgi:signal transduction histidine kinase
LLLWVLYQRRLDQIGREFNLRLDERIGERARIARELHDTLLQSFQGLMLRFQIVRNLLPTHPVEAVQALDKALDQADQAILEGREAILDIRSSPANGDLAQAMASLGDELASKDSPSFDVRVEGSPRDLHPILSNEIHRVVHEGLRNAFCHAQAHRIEAEITYGENLLRVRIRDDGRGMDPRIVEEGRSGHYGLPGMRERAKRIGAQLNVWTGAGAGTEIELSVPGKIAYGTSRRRAGFRLFRGRFGGNS